ncbi:hypothetical protein DM01DRAFT_1332426 [Hesseltinella vesiculosa]|uniref:RING-type domain-containing protein n=1 Tax=Hesseltinella vesiculosa TaxID=101127 RepID=A0A1X2GRU7_9FUNG|nr:hypothetical protein DM01DRAFT_1332426 [Hesseltinella vesiculosa]
MPPTNAQVGKDHADMTTNGWSTWAKFELAKKPALTVHGRPLLDSATHHSNDERDLSFKALTTDDSPSPSESTRSYGDHSMDEDTQTTQRTHVIQPQHQAVPLCFCQQPATKSYSDEFGVFFDCHYMDENSTLPTSPPQPSSHICGFHVHDQAWQKILRDEPVHDQELEACPYFNFTYCVYFQKTNNYDKACPPVPKCFCNSRVILHEALFPTKTRLQFVCPNFYLENARTKCSWLLAPEELAFRKPKNPRHDANFNTNTLHRLRSYQKTVRDQVRPLSDLSAIAENLALLKVMATPDHPLPCTSSSATTSTSASSSVSAPDPAITDDNNMTVTCIPASHADSTPLAPSTSSTTASSSRSILPIPMSPPACSPNELPTLATKTNYSTESVLQEQQYKYDQQTYSSFQAIAPSADRKPWRSPPILNVVAQSGTSGPHDFYPGGESFLATLQLAKPTALARLHAQQSPSSPASEAKLTPCDSSDADHEPKELNGLEPSQAQAPEKKEVQVDDMLLLLQAQSEVIQEQRQLLRSKDRELADLAMHAHHVGALAMEKDGTIRAKDDEIKQLDNLIKQYDALLKENAATIALETSRRTACQRQVTMIESILEVIATENALYVNDAIEKEERITSTLDMRCQLCFDEPVTCAITPCFHAVYCNNCAYKLKECAVCRTPKASIQKIYL